MISLMNKRLRRAGAMTMLGAMAMLTGCSVLTIDVDVYSGPLVNHIDTQVEQVGAMAIGAFPLLVHLRDMLEVGGDLRNSKKLQEKAWYNYGYIPLWYDGSVSKTIKSKDLDDRDFCDEFTFFVDFFDPTATINANMTRDYGLSNPEAMKVNLILYLYHDLDDIHRLTEDALKLLNMHHLRKYYPQNKYPIADQINNMRKTYALDSQSTPTTSPIRATPTNRTAFQALPRPRHGLKEVYLNYVRIKETHPKDENKIEEARDILLLRLVHFSQIVLMIANNDTFFERRPGVLNTVSNGLENLLVGGHESQEAYVRVMQAIGNSIINQVDEIYQYEESQNRLKSRWKVEYEAYKSSIPSIADNIDLSINRAEAGISRNTEKLYIDIIEKSLSEPERKVPANKYPIKQTFDKFVQPSAIDSQTSITAQVELLMGDLHTTASTLSQKIDAKVLESMLSEYVRAVKLIRNRIDQYNAGKKALAKGTKEFEFWLEDVGMILRDPKVGNNNKQLTSIDVLDTRLSKLENELLTAMGDQARIASGDVEIIRNQILAAQFFKASRTPIRPAAAFLRSSYPSTALQRNPSIQAGNMLATEAMRPHQEFFRTLPGAEYFLGDDVSFQTLTNLDKQFWQNVNRVKVKGSGNTNYVVAKDDLGNWYVKNYSADPERIIRSARNLALFAASPATYAGNLAMSRQSLYDLETDQDKTPQELGLPSSVRTVQYVKARERYKDDTSKDLDKLSGEMETLYTELKKMQSPTLSEIGFEAKDHVRTTNTTTLAMMDDIESKLEKLASIRTRWSDYITSNGRGVILKLESEIADLQTSVTLRKQQVDGLLDRQLQLKRFHQELESIQDGSREDRSESALTAVRDRITSSILELNDAQNDLYSAEQALQKKQNEQNKKKGEIALKNGKDGARVNKVITETVAARRKTIQKFQSALKVVGEYSEVKESDRDIFSRN